MNKLFLMAVVLVSCAGCAGQAPLNDEPARLADSPYCLRDTGSRIAQAKGQCVQGHAYSREQIERSGGTTLGDVLRSLTPP